VSASAEEATKLREEIAVPVGYQGRQIELIGFFEKPAGAGSFPVVIALHSCSGYTAEMYGGELALWVAFLQGQGYATFKLDSFTARGYSDVCTTYAVTAADRAADVLAAATPLAGRPDVRPDRIAVIGVSHGGGTAVYVARDHMELRPPRAQLAARGGRLAASMGLYPICGSPEGSPLIVPLLALSGALDDWVPAARCVAIANMPANRLMTVEVYPGAYHAFDIPGMRAHYKLGRMLAYDAAATADAHARVQDLCLPIPALRNPATKAAMRELAGLVFLSSALWAVIATAQVREEFSVPVDYQDSQIQLRAEFQKPATGAGPLPVVIALHDCAGYHSPYSMLAWLALFQQQGYATLRLDSFTARGHYGDICGNTGEVTAVERGTDALSAAYVLAGRPDVRRDRIAVISWSHGGGGAMVAARDGPSTQPAREKLASVGSKLVASIDLYGGCGTTNYLVVVPLLVLVGALDDWSSGGASCLGLAKAQPTRVTVQVYPGAYHGFDSPGETRNNAGHLIGYNAEATADARARATEFLRRYMQ
jgi:dienelactone hydrolase